MQKKKENFFWKEIGRVKERGKEKKRKEMEKLWVGFLGHLEGREKGQQREKVTEVGKSFNQTGVKKLESSKRQLTFPLLYIYSSEEPPSSSHSLLVLQINIK